jgi:mono/diheme cytochrome c family protein
MAQIKYVVFACLILLAGFITVVAFQKISSSQLIKESETQIDNGLPIPVNKEPVSADYVKGKDLFKQHCGPCHAMDKTLSGPALRGVLSRGPWIEDKENFKKWVKNPSAFIPTSQYTIDLQRQYGQVMPSFPQLTDQELELVYEYLKLLPAPVAQTIAFR